MADNPYQPPTPAQKPIPPAQAIAQGAMTIQAADSMRRVKNGGSWFYWLAALSLINSLIAAFDGDRQFLFGLTITQIFDAFGKHFQQQGADWAIGVALAFDVLAAALFAIFGLLALRGVHVMFLVGLAAYGCDALLALALGLYFPLAFHAFVAFQIWNGWRAHRRLDALADAAVATAHAPLAEEA